MVARHEIAADGVTGYFLRLLDIEAEKLAEDHRDFVTGRSTRAHSSA
jgi:hypothetical protein